ncbi:MAG: hypothetical protein JXR73_08540 [Candidatus Omnitrophica bacterium]|nr:hypothetical protein [Candidatus Omnitrophota bacterium]
MVKRFHPITCQLLPLAVLALFLPHYAFAQNIQSGIPEKVPFAYLWDTGAPSPEALSAEAIAAMTGWMRLEEDDVTHAFKGDAVLSNDKILVILRKMGTGAELYSLMLNQPVLRAVLAPLAKEQLESVKLSSLAIAENNPGAAQLNAVFGSDKDALDMGFRLTTGESTIEIHPGQKAEKLRIQGEIHYSIVPDYFGDDMIFSADSWRRDAVLLPVEKYFLNALGNGDALMMCVWQASDQTVRLSFNQANGKQTIGATEIQCQPDQKIWTALLEKKNIWFAWKTQNDAPDWTPPFSAQWRVNRLNQGVQAISQPWTEEFLKTPQSKPLLIYAFDRDRTTPLTVFCPIDVMKNTLGVGPCQYILDAEGLASDDHPTPDLVTEWVEKQFERNREKRSQNQIRDQFEAMSALMAQTQKRLQQYNVFASELKVLCSQEMQDKPDASGEIQRLLDVLEGIEQCIALEQSAVQQSESVDRMAEKIIELIGRENAYPACQAHCAGIRSVAARGNSALSRCRMKTRWLRQLCIMAAGDRPALTDFLNKIRIRTEQMLQNA